MGIYRRSTDNTMVKQKGKTMPYKTLHRKLKDRATWTPLRTGSELMCPWSNICSTSGTRPVTIVTNPETSHERLTSPFNLSMQIS
jgi:hypothetical protein